MKTNKPTHRFLFSTPTLATLLVALALPAIAAQDSPGKFSKRTIDIGIVAKDVEKSAKFYTEAIGLTEVKGFAVTDKLGRDIGLIDGHPVNVRVFVPDNGQDATRIKLMSFPQAPGKAADQKFIHSTYGLSYLTMFVASTDQTLERLKQAGVKPIGNTPISLGGTSRLTTVRDPDGNFIELIGP